MSPQNLYQIWRAAGGAVFGLLCGMNLQAHGVTFGTIALLILAVICIVSVFDKENEVKDV